MDWSSLLPWVPAGSAVIALIGITLSAGALRTSRAALKLAKQTSEAQERLKEVKIRWADGMKVSVVSGPQNLRVASLELEVTYQWPGSMAYRGQFSRFTLGREAVTVLKSSGPAFPAQIEKYQAEEWSFPSSMFRTPRNRSIEMVATARLDSDIELTSSEYTDDNLDRDGVPILGRFALQRGSGHRGGTIAGISTLGQLLSYDDFDREVKEWLVKVWPYSPNSVTVFDLPLWEYPTGYRRAASHSTQERGVETYGNRSDEAIDEAVYKAFTEKRVTFRVQGGVTGQPRLLYSSLDRLCDSGLTHDAVIAKFSRFAKEDLVTWNTETRSHLVPDELLVSASFSPFRPALTTNANDFGPTH